MTRKTMMPAIELAAARSGVPTAVLSGVRHDGGAGDVAALLKEVQAQLVRVESDVKKTAEDALKQARDTGTQSADIRRSADELLIAQRQLTDAQAKLTDRLETLETRNTDLEQKLAARGAGKSDRKRSIGQIFAENDQVRAFAKNGSKGTVRLALQVNQAITSIDGSAGDLIWSDRETEIVGMPRRTMTIRSLLSQGRTSSNLVEYAKQIMRTNNAAVVSEGVQKPESTYVWDRADAPVRTIAHFVHVSRQAMDDAAQLQTEIDTELRYGLALAEELQLLKGSGVGENIEGLVTAATAYSAPFALSGETMIDTLRLAILQVALNDYPSDGIVLHPTDWARIELLKDGEQRYLFANVMQLTGPQLWGQPIVATQSMDADEFLVGSFRMAGTIYDRMDPEVLASSEDRDNFVKNMITVRAEERLALAVKRPASLVTGDFGNISG